MLTIIPEGAMRVVHISYFYGDNTSGANVAATRIHQALLDNGIDSHYICFEKKESGENVHVLPHGNLLHWIFYYAIRVFWVATRIVFGRIIMMNILPLPGLKKLISQLKPTVIHIHSLFQDVASFKQLQNLRYPLVFTLHDLLIANAIESHPQSDPRFNVGFTSCNSCWIERWLWNRKKHFIQATHPIFTGPSRWVCDRFLQSNIGRNQDIVEISNPIGRKFKYIESLRHPHDRFTILYGACGGRSDAKGWSDLIGAVAKLDDNLKKNMVLNVFGETHEDSTISGIQVHFLGIITSTEEMIKAHHDADIFAFPSRMETQGMVKLEAFADGLPVLAFNRTACAEGIQHKQNGWIAEDGDLGSYASGIIYYYDLFKSGRLDGIRHQIAQDAISLWNDEIIVRRITDVYDRAAKR